MKHSCQNIPSILFQLSLKENWYVIFFFSNMKKEARRQSWEKQMLPKGQRWHLVVLVFVPATPTSTDVQFLLDYTVFLAVNTRTMDPTPPAASAWKQTKCKCWQDHEGSILIPSKIFFFKKKFFFLKEGMCAAIDFEFTNFDNYLLSAYYARRPWHWGIQLETKPPESLTPGACILVRYQFTF